MSNPENYAGYDPYTRTPYGEVVTAMVTPFDDEHELNLDVAAQLVDDLIEHGTQGIVVAGTTGESPTLSHFEHLDLVETVLQTSTVPVLVGAGSNNTREAIEISQDVRKMQSYDPNQDGLLHVVPYYNRPPQEGLYLHFEAIADSVPDTDIILYDIPGRTGVELHTETILRLAGVRNIVGLKDAKGQREETDRIISELGPEFLVYSGDDEANLALRRAGAVGAISVASHWAGEEIAEMFEAVARGDQVRADEINALLQSSYDFETNAIWRNPMPAKAAMRALGVPVGECRLPLSPTSELAENAARRVFADLPSRRDELNQDI